MNTPELKTILLVDDNPEHAIVVTNILEMGGYAAIVATTIADGVRLAAIDTSIGCVMLPFRTGEGNDARTAASSILTSRRLPILFVLDRFEHEAVDCFGRIAQGWIFKNSDGASCRMAIESACRLFDEEQTTRLQDLRLQHLLARTETLRGDERKAIALEIHDRLGQELSAIKMNVAVLAARAKRGEDITEKVTTIRELVDASMVSARKISASLRPDLLEDIGLAAAITSTVREFEARHGISCSTKIDAANTTVSPDIFNAFISILQEALTNVAKHAAATQVLVKFSVQGISAELAVFDNGKGISDAYKQETHSFGILGMSERASRFGGTLTVKRLAEKGTSITARIPRINL